MASIVEYAKRTPILMIGQTSKANRAALDAAVRRGELVKGRAPFAGRLAMKTCYAASHEAIEAKIAADRFDMDRARAMDAINRREAA